MSEYYIEAKGLKEICPRLSVGDRIFLSGEVYTARDAAHKRIFESIKQGGELPFSIKGAIIYYAGPTPAPEGLAVGSCGPTTSARMDKYTPALLDSGLTATIGKGERSRAVREAIVKNNSVYFCAIGGAGALACKHIVKSEIVAYEDLGCEAVRRLTFNSFPLIVGIDSTGQSIFDR
ncbi:MAG: fumarate hydratase C-terminal domain-containing protein [Clostridia bacterium]|nr:fumarate hydratase C-terminal domain-containing protein [Clostridia bacterium]